MSKAMKQDAEKASPLPPSDANLMGGDPTPVAREVELRTVLRSEKESYFPPVLSDDLLSDISVESWLSRPREVDIMDETDDGPMVPGSSSSTPGPEGPAEVLDENVLKYLDDPKEHFTNVSAMPWHESGTFNGEEDFCEEFNKDFTQSTGRNTSSVYTTLAYVFCCFSGGLKVKKWFESVTDVGNFSVARIGTGYRAFGQGYHVLPGFDSGWVHTNIPFDEEPQTNYGVPRTVRKLTEYHTILLVPSGHLGVARIAIRNPDQHKYPGDKGDMVLFQQGKYLLRENYYTDINTVRYDPSKYIIPIGPEVFILNIPEGFLGGVRSIKDNRYSIITPGKPCLLDRKEYCDPGFVDLSSAKKILYANTEGDNETTTQNVSQKFMQILNLSEGDMASVKRLDGKSYLIDRPGQYILQSSSWNLSVSEVVAFEPTVKNSSAGNTGDYRESFDQRVPSDPGHFLTTALFYIVLVDPDQFGVVQSLKDGSYHLLDRGKHVLNKGDWKAPEIFSIHQQEIRTKAFTVTHVTNDLLVGAFSRSGEWVDFSESHAGKRILLLNSKYEPPTQVKRQTTDLVDFGPYTYTNIISNVHVMYLENGTIKEGKPGPQMLPAQTTILLESLPKGKQVVSLGCVNFKTVDQFGMQIEAKLVVEIRDPVATTKFIRSKIGSMTEHDLAHEDHIVGDQAADALTHAANARKFFQKSRSVTYADAILSTIIQQCIAALERRLSFKNSGELTTNADNTVALETIGENVRVTEQESLREIEAFCVSNSLGVTCCELKLLGSFTYTSRTIEEARQTREESKMKAKTLEYEKQTIQKQAEANAIRQIEEANAVSQVQVIQKQAEQKAQSISLQMQTADEKNENEIRIARQKAEDEIESIKQDRSAQKVKIAADAEAYSINLLAEAKANGDRLSNEVAKNRPVELALQEYLSINAKAVEAVAKAGNLYPAEFKAMLGIAGMGSNGETQGTGPGSAGAANNLFQFNMLNQLVQSFSEQQTNLKRVHSKAATPKS